MIYRFTIPQLYYWKVKFADGYELSQYNKLGSEILIKNIVDKTCLVQVDGKTSVQKMSNYFLKYEKKHGRVMTFGLYLFTPGMRRIRALRNIGRLLTLQPTIEYLQGDVSSQTFVKDIPEDRFVTFYKSSGITYGTDMHLKPVGKPMGVVKSYTVGILNRENPAQGDIFTLNITGA